MNDPPIAAWFIVAAWAAAGVQAALSYPFGLWDEVVTELKNE